MPNPLSRKTFIGKARRFQGLFTVVSLNPPPARLRDKKDPVGNGAAKRFGGSNCICPNIHRTFRGDPNIWTTHPRRRKWAGHFRRFPIGHLRQLVAMPVYGAPGAGQCAVRRAAAATSPRAPGFRYIRPRWVEAARAAAAGRGRKMVPSVLLPAFAAPRRTGGAPVREAAQVAGRCAPAG